MPGKTKSLALFTVSHLTLHTWPAVLCRFVLTRVSSVSVCFIYLYFLCSALTFKRDTPPLPPSSPVLGHFPHADRAHFVGLVSPGAQKKQKQKQNTTHLRSSCEMSLARIPIRCYSLFFILYKNEYQMNCFSLPQFSHLPIPTHGPALSYHMTATGEGEGYHVLQSRHMKPPFKLLLMLRHRAA